MSVVIYHNPHCSKSRRTLDILREKGVEPTIVDYLKTPPSEAELRRLLSLLGKRPRDLIRKGETAYRDNGLDDPALTDEELIRALARHPVLIERPIVLARGKAVLGRPPESVLTIL